MTTNVVVTTYVVNWPAKESALTRRAMGATEAAPSRLDSMGCEKELVLGALVLASCQPTSQPVAPQDASHQQSAEERRLERERVASEVARADQAAAEARAASDSVRALADADDARRAEDQRRSAAFAERQSADEADLKAACLLDVSARTERRRRAQGEIVALEAKEAAAKAWVDAHCKRVEVPTLERRLCDDGSAVAKICNVETGSHDELRCPPGAPQGVTKYGVEIPEPPSEIRGIVAFEADMKRNRQCGDVPPLQRRSQH